MKKQTLFFLLGLLMITSESFAQYSGSFIVHGDLGKYYPVLFNDVSWYNNKATEFEIGRSNVHTDALWRGSLIAKFRVHTTNYGHGSRFIDANIRQADPVYGKYFVAGWADATGANGNAVVVVWLQGGDNTYYLNCPVNVSPVVYDGVQQALPYQEINGPARTYKTSIDDYVNSNGDNIEGSAFYTGGADNYFAGYVGIGTKAPDELLTVDGTIHSKEVKVDTSIPVPDYVFGPTYKLPQLSELKIYLDANHHLPEIPAAAEIKKNGLNLGEMNIKLLKKVEELTLYLIDEDKEAKDQREINVKQEERIKKLEQQLNAIIKEKR